MSLTSSRTTFMNALRAPGRVVYDEVHENLSAPFVACVPDDPYLVAEVIGSKFRQNFNLYLGVTYKDNKASIAKLEALIESVVALFPAGTEFDSISAPSLDQRGANQYLVVTIPVSIRAN